MGDSTVFTQPLSASHRSSAGIILKIRLENFMCHSSLQIELGEWLNFVTGQNGSNSLFLYICMLVFNWMSFVVDKIAWFLIFTGGKSAILTALCVAFGSRAKETQRATTLKEFIKTGCRFVAFGLCVLGGGVGGVCWFVERVIFFFKLYFLSFIFDKSLNRTFWPPTINNYHFNKIQTEHLASMVPPCS